MPIASGRRVTAFVSLFLLAWACDGSGPDSPSPGPGQRQAPPTGPAPQGRWEARAPLPDTPRMYGGVAATRDRVFLVAGLGQGPGFTRGAEPRVVHSYDPRGDAWTTEAMLPDAFNMPNVAAVGDRLFVLGALGTSDVLEYDRGNRAWLPRKPLPVVGGRGAAAVGVSGTRILVAGGITPGQSANMLNTGVRHGQVMAYDTATDTWQMLPPLAHPRGYALGAVLGGLFFVIGGSSDFVRTDQVDALDLAKNEWLIRQPVPRTVSSGSIAVAKGRIYLLGGIATSSGMITPQTIALDPITDTWSEVAPMTTARFAMGAATLDDRIYVPTGAAQLGGPNMFGPVPVLEVFVP